MSSVLRPGRGFNWISGTFIIGYHLALLVGLPFYFVYAQPAPAMIVTALVLLFLSQIGIGAAYHRFYSHRCYTLSRPIEAIFLFLATFATQGSALQWSYDHRLHHIYIDTDDDPYSIKKGFWYAHVLWIFENSRPIEERRVPDLLANPLVVWQDRYIGVLTIGSNLLVFLLAGWLLGDFLGAFVLVWWTRLMVSHHLTWFVNSLAHFWGSQPYSSDQSAVDNPIVAILTVGEGYHNFHHTFPGDYRNGVRWYQFDPVKWTIWCLSKLGLAGNLRRFNRFKIMKRVLAEDLRRSQRRLASSSDGLRGELALRLEAAAKRMRTTLDTLNSMAERLRRLDPKPDGDIRQKVMDELRRRRRDLRREWREWHRLCAVVHSPG